MFPFDDHPLYTSALIFVLAFGAISFPALFWIVAPYGRHARAGWGPTIPARWGWVIMEAPSPIGFALVYFQSEAASRPAPAVLFALWQVHYLYRAFVFPFRMRAEGKRKPALTVGLAFLFNCCNGPMNAFAITMLAPHLLGDSAHLTPRFLSGCAVFGIGWAINQRSDSILRNLRAPGETGYKIPHGGMFRFVTSPNYLGEIIEWTGFAIAAWTAPALAFALFTAANLVPRAVAHHSWYHEKFPEYPPQRRAVIPYFW